jgi:Bacterial aa3 type cytochrome c oxidase subunit IV
MTAALEMVGRRREFTMSVDQELRRHQATYRGFTRMLTWGSALVVTVIVILALITL